MLAYVPMPSHLPVPAKEEPFSIVHAEPLRNSQCLTSCSTVHRSPAAFAELQPVGGDSDAYALLPITSFTLPPAHGRVRQDGTCGSRVTGVRIRFLETTSLS